MSAKSTKKTTDVKVADAAKPVAKPTPTTGKKKLVVSYKNLSPEVLELVKEKYPTGYSDMVIKVDKGNGDFFYAITLDTAEASYLIKVDVKVDTEIDEVERQLFGGGSSDDAGGEEDFPDSEDANFGSDEDE